MEEGERRTSSYDGFFLSLLLLLAGGWLVSAEAVGEGGSRNNSLCAAVIRPLGYPCFEHTVETKDGYILAIQRIPNGRELVKSEPGPAVFLQHGLFQGGDTWFANSIEESLGFILADSGFDVWVGNVRGTNWSHGHVSLSESNKEFWDWSWEELALYDLSAMINYVYSATNSKVHFVGHSQGTIMALAAFTQPMISEMVAAASLLCPISYLDHISSHFVLRAVSMHVDQMLVAIGLHQLNFRSNIGIQVLESVCDGHINCSDLLSAITGNNCCFNNSRVDQYLKYEPQPSSTKNLRHLFQMIRKGTFSRFDYGPWGNLKSYGSLKPPAFDLTNIPDSLPLWIAYGGQDALAVPTDIDHTLQELQPEPQMLYLDSYGHMDFILSPYAKTDVYDKLIEFLRSCGRRSTY
ncbi:triacylglycerol lipase 1 [Nymphaea colorata]|nr:triacylglycerol lipase 1 [Nymphaea colorata]